MELIDAPMPISKRVAVLAVFSAIAIALEVFPIPGITDLKLVPAVPSFTIDWTGIPITFIFLVLGFNYSLVAVATMALAIGYRNPIGAVFKAMSEFLTVLGMLAGLLMYRCLAEKHTNRRKREIKALLMLLGGVFFRMMGMYVANILLLPLLLGLPESAAISASEILIPWNGLQAVINILGGLMLLRLVPREVLLEAGLDTDSTNIHRE